MNYVPAVGPKEARIAFIGEAPGAEEDKQKSPFVGYSGEFFRERLNMVGLSFEECFVTNTCHFRPPYNDISKWFTPRNKKQKCNEYVTAGIIELFTDLAEVVEAGGGNVLVPLGNTALWALTGLDKIAKRRGSILQVTANLDAFNQIKSHYPDLLSIAAESFKKIEGRKVIPCLHPASVTRQITMSPIFLFDLNRIVEEAAHPNVILPQRTHYINPSQEEAAELARRLLEFQHIACDIETVGRRLFSMQFSGDPSWSLVLTADQPWKKELIRLLCESENEKIFQFGWFDVWFLLTRERILVNNYTYDTAIAARVSYPDFPVGLDFQTSLQTREPYYKDDGKNWDPREAKDVERFLTYGGRDACVTKEIAGVHMRDELSEPGTRVAFEHKMKLVPIAIEMETRGIKIDIAEMQNLREKYAKQARDLQEILDQSVAQQTKEILEGTSDKKKREACEYILKKMLENKMKNKPAFNVGSTGEGQLVDTFLYTVRAFKPVYKGKGAGRKRTTDEEALKELYGDSGDGLLLTIVTKRKTEKLLNTELSVKVDELERTYFSVNPCHTKSGRWSFTENIDGYGCNGQAWDPRAKGMIIPDDGYILGNFDLAQVEDRIVAYYAGVSKKIWAFENGVDAHALTAQGIFGGTIEEIIEEERECKKNGKQSPRRYLGKQSNHAYNYGEGPVRFWKRVNKRRDETGISITRTQAFQAKEAHGRLYPEVEWYKKDIDARVYRDRCLTNIFGWTRKFHGVITDEVKRDAYSWIPQSSAPWIIDLGMLAIRERLPQVQLLLHGHDSIVCQFPISEADDLKEEIIKLMTIPIEVNGHEITIPVDGKLSMNYKG